ncbi:MAG: hypothetical protein GYB66_08285 [Chloroflexi bacterium]|nr:hypothetical protein [Chloroflexota bacterium]
MLKSFRATRLALWVVIIVAGFVLGACSEDDTPPPTEVLIVPGQTATPTLVGSEDSSGDDTAPVALQRTLEALEATNTALEATLAYYDELGRQEAAETPESASAQSETPPPATTQPLPTATLRPSNFPTPRVESTMIAEQIFEGGRMIWLRENRQVWVLVGDSVDPQRGDWYCFEDTFVEGGVEFLPTLEPPAAATTDSDWVEPRIQQPIRGFGKIWRDNEDLRAKLGWALASEIEHSARREYIAGGIVNQDDVYVPAPGEWRISSFYGETLIMNESELGSDCPSGTWRLNRPN